MENRQKENTEEFIAKESRTEFDAVHPRFVRPEETQVREFQREHDYFCEPCNLFLAPTIQALKYHFKKGRVTHQPRGSCFYCKGPVYEYKLNDDSLLYHICETTRND